MRWLAGRQLPRGLVGKTSRERSETKRGSRVDTGIHVEICRECVDVPWQGSDGERETERKRMELQLGGKHIIINEAERIAAVDSHVRTGVAISAFRPASR